LQRSVELGAPLSPRLRTSREHCHYPVFAGWNALETLFLGFEEGRLGSDCLIGFRELERKDYGHFMRGYRKNPCWRNMQAWPEDVEDVEAVEQLSTVVRTMYQGYGEKPDCFLEKLEIVSIAEL
jgi:hypothetical protein